MLEARIRNPWQRRGLTIALLGATAALSSCASPKPATALVSDPDARIGSAIPWNKPADWEGRGNIPSGGFGGSGAFGGSSGANGGTGGY